MAHTPKNQSEKAILTARRAWCYLVLVLISFLCLFFFYVLIINSTRTHFEIQKGFSLMPGKSIITNFRNVLTDANIPVVSGIRNSLRQPQQFQTQICALLRAAARGPLRVMFPMVTDVEDWDAAMSIVEHCRQSLRERGVPFNENTPFGVMLSIPAACLTVEDFVAHGCDFLVIGTNDLTQYTHAADRELASAEHYYRPASPAMKKLITMVMDAASAHHVPVTICGLAVGNPANTAQYLHLGLRSFSVSPQNLLKVKQALLDTDAHPDAGENG